MRRRLALPELAAVAAASSGKAKRRRKVEIKPPPSDDEVAVFYAAKVNSDEYLPRDLFSSRTCGLMLVRGLVTPERLRQRLNP